MPQNSWLFVIEGLTSSNSPERESENTAALERETRTFLDSIPGVLQEPGNLRFHRRTRDANKISICHMFMISNKETSCRVHKHTDGGPGDD